MYFNPQNETQAMLAGKDNMSEGQYPLLVDGVELTFAEWLKSSGVLMEPASLFEHLVGPMAETTFDQLHGSQPGCTNPCFCNLTAGLM